MTDLFSWMNNHQGATANLLICLLFAVLGGFVHSESRIGRVASALCWWFSGGFAVIGLAYSVIK